jgi:LruC domain-containing protein
MDYIKYALRVALLGSLVIPATGQTSFTPVPQEVINTIGTVLPESSNAGASYVSSVYSPNLEISEPAQIQVIFIWEGAGYRNSLGYFTYEEQSDGSVAILSRNLLIPDASFPSVGNAQIGDTYDLLDASGSPRLFQPGENVGFFVVADGWNSEPQIQAWNSATATIPASDPAINATFGRGCYTSIDKLNPEITEGAVEESRHLAMLWMPPEAGFLGSEAFLVSGFEDLRRTNNSDDDFNDLVFVVSANPISSLENTPAFNYEPGDPDGDGVVGVLDSYPDDASRAFVTRYPTHGETVVGLEDQYPGLGDADYNDCVLAYNFQLVTDAVGNVKDVMATMHLVARGAGYNHRVGLHMPGIPSDATGSVSIERFLSDEDMSIQLEPVRTISSVIEVDMKRIPDLFPSTTSALPPGFGETFTNTQSGLIDRPGASSRVLITFDQAVAPAVLGQVPYDLYASIYQGAEEWDVHFPGFEGFPERPSSLPIETGSSSFLDDLGRPWLVEIPTNWRFPMEQIRVWEGYPDFSSWAASNGVSYQDWYLNPTAQPGLLAFELWQYVPARSWTILLPTP